MNGPQVAFFGDHPGLLRAVYPESRVQRIEAIGELFPTTITRENFQDMAADLQKIEYIFSTWGMPALTESDLNKLPNLKIVFYGAGTVKQFAEPLLRSGVRIVSAWAANAVPVAEFTVAQITLATKGYFAASRAVHGLGPEGWKHLRMPGNYDITVSILGAGMVGAEVIRRLAEFDISILVFDPYLSDQSARDLGVTKVDLEHAFSQGFVVSNHLANVPATEKLLTKSLFASMLPNSTFINTGRGATADEAGMIEVLTQRPDITALLDVAEPEPPVAGSALYQLPNVWLSPHIAGSIGQEVVRMADTVIAEFERELGGERLLYEVTLDKLASMA